MELDRSRDFGTDLDLVDRVDDPGFLDHGGNIAVGHRPGSYAEFRTLEGKETEDSPGGRAQDDHKPSRPKNLVFFVFIVSLPSKSQIVVELQIARTAVLLAVSRPTWAGDQRRERREDVRGRFQTQA